MLLTVVIPGLGHVYLQLWKRALLWLLVYVATTTVFLPEESMPESLSMDAFVAAGEAVPLEVTLLILSISLLCLLDVYMMTREINERARRASGRAVATCPNCGEELDEDLDFCHWCTTRLDTDDGERT